MTPPPPSNTRPPRLFFDFALRERAFLIILMVCFVVAALTYQTPHIAMWVGFAFAGYSAVANDSIQTLGTFIASNRDQKWWILWLYIGSIFIATMLFGWVKFGGDISYERLTSKGFDVAPTSFSFLQIAAPLFLLIITRLRMPVSTSILLLSCFATQAKGITDVLSKSVGGYVIAFVVSIIIWGTLGRWMQRRFTGAPHPIWRVIQGITTGSLWAVWLAQDAANIAVYLPRTLTAGQLVPFLGFIFFGLGILFYQRGEKVQEVVEEKSAVADIRPAAVVDFVYGLILFYKMTASTIPMSTTWVFIGLLGGRELALTWWQETPGRKMGGAVRMVVRDLATVGTGLIISLLLAIVINDVIRHAWIPPAFDAEGGACVHIRSGDSKDRDASAEAPNLAAVDNEASNYVTAHRMHQVALGGGQGGNLGYLAFEWTGGDAAFLLSDDVPFTLIAADGTNVELEAMGNSNECAPIDAWYTATLPLGAYAIRIGPTDLDGIGIVIE